MELHIGKDEADYIADSIYAFNDFLIRNDAGENVTLSNETKGGIILLLRAAIAKKILNTIPDIHIHTLFRNLGGILPSSVGFDGTCSPLGTQSTVQEDGSCIVHLGVDKTDRYQHIPPQDNEPIKLTLDSRGDHFDYLRIDGHIIDLLASLEKKPAEEVTN